MASVFSKKSTRLAKNYRYFYSLLSQLSISYYKYYHFHFRFSTAVLLRQQCCCDTDTTVKTLSSGAFHAVFSVMV